MFHNNNQTAQGRGRSYRHYTGLCSRQVDQLNTCTVAWQLEHKTVNQEDHSSRPPNCCVETWAVSFTPLCICRFEEKLKSVDPSTWCLCLWLKEKNMSWTHKANGLSLHRIHRANGLSVQRPHRANGLSLHRTHRANGLSLHRTHRANNLSLHRTHRANGLSLHRTHRANGLSLHRTHRANGLSVQRTHRANGLSLHRTHRANGLGVQRTHRANGLSLH